MFHASSDGAETLPVKYLEEALLACNLGFDNRQFLTFIGTKKQGI